MNSSKKIISALLALLMLTSVSCGDTGSTDDTTDGATTTPSGETTEKVDLLDQLPNKDYGGRKFTVAVSVDSETDILAEELNGDILNDALWTRNDKVNDKFKIEIEPYMLFDDVYGWYIKLNNYVLAGENVCDLAGHYAYRINESISAEILRDWNTVDSLELDNPWWAREINDGATFNGKLFGLSGYVGMSMMQYAQAMFFNQTHIENYGIKPEDIYKLVNDGKWTFDAFQNIVKDMYDDLNKDGKRGEEDFYGFGLENATALDLWQTAFDIPITGHDKDGSITLNLLTDKRVEAMERVHSMLTTNNGVYLFAATTDPTWTWVDQLQFSRGKLAFVNGPFLAAYEIYRDMDDVYGVVPFPKWDETQDKYYSTLNDRYTIWSIPKTVEDPELTGLVVEALARETYQNVYPKYYDVALKEKFSTDENYAAMVDLVMEGMDFDCAYMFGALTARAPYIFRDLLKEGSTDLASKYAEIKNQIEDGLEEIDKLYQ